MQGIDRIYVINLERRPDRLEEFRQRFPYDVSCVTRIDGIDGCRLTTLPPHIHLRRGEIGALLSHAQAWTCIANDSIDTHRHVVFEDDVHFDTDFIQKWNSLYSPTLPDPFSIAFIGGRFTPQFRGRHDPSERINKNWYYSNEDRTFHAYIVTPPCARQLLSLLNREMASKRGIINAVDALINIWNATGCIQPPVISSVELICYSPLYYKTDVQTFATVTRHL